MQEIFPWRARTPGSFEVLPLNTSQIFYPKIATSLIARIAGNNEDRNIIG